MELLSLCTASGVIKEKGSERPVALRRQELVSGTPSQIAEALTVLESSQSRMMKPVIPVASVALHTSALRYFDKPPRSWLSPIAFVYEIALGPSGPSGPLFSVSTCMPQGRDMQLKLEYAPKGRHTNVKIHSLQKIVGPGAILR